MIYLAHNGEFEAIRHKKSFKMTNNLQSEEHTNEYKKFIGPLKPTNLSQTINKMRKDTIAKFSEIRIALFCSGQIFGIEDVLQSRPHTVTVKCLTNDASLYSIPAQEFFHVIRRDDKTQSLVREVSFLKDISTIGKIKGSQKFRKIENVMKKVEIQETERLAAEEKHELSAPKLAVLDAEKIYGTAGSSPNQSKLKKTMNINLAKSLPKLIQKHNMKIPVEKLLDSREAMHEIVKNNDECFDLRTQNRFRDRSVAKSNRINQPVPSMLVPKGGGRATS